MDVAYINSSLNLTEEKSYFVSNVVFLCFQITNFLLGLPLNVYVVYLLTKAEGLHESVIFILNHCACEILYALSSLLYIICVFINNTFYFKLLGFFIGIFMSARPLFQSCVSLERYLAVVHPLIFLKFKPLRYRLVGSVVIWTCMFPFIFAVMFTFPNVPFVLYGSLYFAILIVDLFCCISVLKALRRSRPGERDVRNKDYVKKNVKEKAFEIVFINLLIFLIQNLPVGIVLSLMDTFVSVIAFNCAITISLSLGISAGFVQVLFYLQNTIKQSFPLHVLKCRKVCGFLKNSQT